MTEAARPTQPHSPTTVALVAAGVRLLALCLFTMTACSIFSQFLQAFTWKFNPFGEIPSAWHSMTADWAFTWGWDIARVAMGVLLWVMPVRIARICLRKIPARGCAACGYDRASGGGMICPECGVSDSSP